MSDLPASWRTLYELTRLTRRRGRSTGAPAPGPSAALGLASLPSALHQAAKAIRRLAQGVIVQVGVAGRRLGLGMAEQTTDDMQAHAAADQADSVRIAAAASIFFCGTCNTFFGAPLCLRRRAAAASP